MKPSLAEPRTHSEFLPYLLNRVVAQINSPMQRELRRRSMTMTHWRVLGFLVEQDGLIISELADRTVTDQATLSRALDRLEARRMIRRQVSPTDSRQVLIHLCPAGRAEYECLTRVGRQIEDWAFAELSDDQTRQMAQLLQLLSASLGARVPPQQMPAQQAQERGATA
ncbi:MAG: MarR family transcriptional regulator [Burkholderiaceae bacterium]